MDNIIVVDYKMKVKDYKEDLIMLADNLRYEIDGLNNDPYNQNKLKQLLYKVDKAIQVLDEE